MIKGRNKGVLVITYHEISNGKRGLYGQESKGKYKGGRTNELPPADSNVQTKEGALWVYSLSTEVSPKNHNKPTVSETAKCITSCKLPGFCISENS